jgi:excisionase family DNA binding protein
VIVDGPGVFVPAPVCARLERTLLEAADAARRQGLALDLGAAHVIDEISTVAGWWRASAARKPAGPSAEVPGSSPPMTVNDAAAMLGVSASRIRQRLRAGDLAGERSNGRWRIDRAAIEARGDA